MTRGGPWRRVGEIARRWRVKEGRNHACVPLLPLAVWAALAVVPSLIAQNRSVSVGGNKTQTVKHEAAKAAINNIRAFAEDLNREVESLEGQIRFGDGQHGRRLPTAKKSDTEQPSYRPGRVTPKPRVASLQTITQLAKKMEAESSKVLAYSGGRDDARGVRLANQLQSAIKQLQAAIRKLPAEPDAKKDLVTIEEVKKAVKRIPTHTKEWSDHNSSDPG